MAYLYIYCVYIYCVYVIQGDWPSDLEAAPVNLKVCLTARDDGTALCLNRTTRINGEEVFILFNDLLPSVEYEGSGESCLFCGDTACSAIPIRSVLEPNDCKYTHHTLLRCIIIASYLTRFLGFL